MTETVYFPGKTELPTPSTDSVSYEWQEDGALKLSWSNPTGEFDGINGFVDQQDSGLFDFTVPKDTEEITIPTTEIAKLTAFKSPVSIILYLRLYSKTT